MTTRESEKTSKNGKTKFFAFRQNNSGGVFDYDLERGIGITVIVEAACSDDANNRAESIGLYFGGEGDCSCCGDRWSSQWREDGADFPWDGYDETVHIQDKLVSVANEPLRAERWLAEDEEFPVFVHYVDGSIRGYASGHSREVREAL